MPRLTDAEKKAIEAHRRNECTVPCPFTGRSEGEITDVLLADLRQANEEIDAWKQMFERAGRSRERLENRLKQAQEREKRAVGLLRWWQKAYKAGVSSRTLALDSVNDEADTFLREAEGAVSKGGFDRRPR